MATGETKVCEKCKKQLELRNFYTYKNGQKTKMCKSCMTMHVDNYDESTYLWILQQMDVPYIPAEWIKIRDKAYAKNPTKMNGQSVLGKYLSLMKLNQHKNKTWADTAKEQEKYKAKMQAQKEEQQKIQEQAKAQFEAGQISQAQYRTLVDSDFQRQNEKPTPMKDAIGQNNMFNENNFLSEEDLPNPAADLTMDEKKMLAVKWGRMYQPNEWIELERIYQDMTRSFDIQDADSKQTLIFICKTTLKMNQALDCGDIEGYQKLSRVYDNLRKSAKFTAAQNKEQKADFIDSIGQLVAYCEKEGHQIPKYEIKTPYDKIDKIIDDMKEYNRSLIYEDHSLAQQIQDYIKQARAAAAIKRDKAQAKAKGYEAPQLTTQDTLAYKEFIKTQTEQAQKQMRGEGEEDESTIIS